MNDDDIRAFGPAPAVSAAPRPRRRLWPWLLAALLVLTLLAAGALAALWAVADSAHPGLHVIVNGQSWDGWDAWASWEGWASWTGIDGDIGPGRGLGLLLGLLVAALVLLLVVPFTVLFGLALGLMGLAIGLAVTVGALGAVAAVLLSPLWGLGLLVWLVLRRRSPPAARMAA
jgi:hypothetical protein